MCLRDSRPFPWETRIEKKAGIPGKEGAGYPGRKTDTGLTKSSSLSSFSVVLWPGYRANLLMPDRFQTKGLSGTTTEIKRSSVQRGLLKSNLFFALSWGDTTRPWYKRLAWHPAIQPVIFGGCAFDAPCNAFTCVCYANAGTESPENYWGSV